MKLGKLEEQFAQIHSEFIPYYTYWSHRCPMAVSTQRDDELHALQQILYKCVAYYADHYAEFLDLVPYQERILEILDFCRCRPYRAGSFRPDFVISESGEIRLCEITSRFFGNGYFLSWFFDYIGRRFAHEAGVTDCRQYFEPLFRYYAALPGKNERICVVKSADRSDSIRLYVPFYRALGYTVEVFEAEQVPENAGHFRGAMVLSALNQKDLLAMPSDTVEKLIEADCHNDLRTVFLIHDKRFFSLFSNRRFTEACLTREETAFLQAHTIQTWLYGNNPEIWEDARLNKNGYIIKPADLGKSEHVHAGCMCSEEEWQGIFDSDLMPGMILQPFVRQKLYRTVWEGQQLAEFVSGTMLCVDDDYYGPGFFRSSAKPVINQGQEHKIAQVITDQAGRFETCHIL